MFLFRLARLLGKTVRELTTTMSVGELHGWSKYLSLEPSNSIEIQSALIAQVANNAMGGKAKLKDMLITTAESRKEKTVEDMVRERPNDNAVKLAFGIFRN